jgi:hypothetical protein
VSVDGRPPEVAILGAGAVGSWLAALLPTDVASTTVDHEIFLPENLPTSCFAPADCFQPKSLVAAAGRRDRGAVARGLRADVRYAVRPGFVRALRAVLVALDNPSAIRDVAEVAWDASVATVPLIVVTCGNEATLGGYQVRVFLPARDRVCPVCLRGRRDRDADRGASCALTSAPRASAEAARAAAEAGTRVLRRWLDGDGTLAGTRLQCDRSGRPEYHIRMPLGPVGGCPVPHHAPNETVVDLDGTVGTLKVGTLAERALASAGNDAELLLGRREIPVFGMKCPRCDRVTPPPLRLLPAATLSRQCGCVSTLVPFATRSRVAARALAASDAAAITLSSFGCAPGEELLAVGARGTVRLRTRFDWSELA